MLKRLQRLWAAFTLTVPVLSLLGAAVAEADSTIPAILPVTTHKRAPHGPL